MTTVKAINSISNILVMLLLPFFTGCVDNNNVVWSEFTQLPTSGWNVLDGREFNPFCNDSIASGEYRPVIVIRHNEEYPYTQLWLELEQSDDRGFHTDTVCVPITDKGGRFLGSGPFGLFELNDTLDYSMKVSPGWQLSIRHLMNTPDVEGLNNLGVILLKKQ